MEASEESGEIEAALCRFFGERGTAEGLAAVYLFGSFARGTAGPASDVDVGLLYSQAPPPTLEGRGFQIEAALAILLRRPVEVVVLNDAPVDLTQRVLRDGRLVYDQGRARRIAFEIKTRNEFWDLEPFIRRSRERREPLRDRKLAPQS